MAVARWAPRTEVATEVVAPSTTGAALTSIVLRTNQAAWESMGASWAVEPMAASPVAATWGPKKAAAVGHAKAQVGPSQLADVPEAGRATMQGPHLRRPAEEASEDWSHDRGSSRDVSSL